MGRTYKDMKIRVDGKRRAAPDARKLARLVIELAQAQSELDIDGETPRSVRRQRQRVRRKRSQR